jgi:rhodanese-related sulfurtransferase
MTPGGPGQTPDITPRDLAGRLARDEPLALLDVREPVERSFCSIAVPASVPHLHVPVGLVPARLEEIRSAGAGKAVVVYCHHGVRSRMVCDWLRIQGVGGLFNLAGGIDAWSEDVDPRVPRY